MTGTTKCGYPASRNEKYGDRVEAMDLDDEPVSMSDVAALLQANREAAIQRATAKLAAEKEQT